jgi:hypothetical protein
MKVPWRNVFTGGVLVVGLLQMSAHFTGIKWMQGLGVLSVASPYPKVFCDVKGLETFASKFTIYHQTPDLDWTQIAMTPELYSQLQGSYNRRNVYGAALSYGPRLPESIWRSIFDYGLANDGPLRHELGLPRQGVLLVYIETATRGRSDVWILGGSETQCEALKAWIEISRQDHLTESERACKKGAQR